MPALAAGVSFHRRHDREQSVLHRDFDTETVETASRIVLHVRKSLGSMKLLCGSSDASIPLIAA